MRRLSMAAAAAALAFASISAHAGTCQAKLPNGDAPICSQTFQFSAWCAANPQGGATDMVYSWRIAGKADWRLTPWLPYPVYFVGAQLTDFGTPKNHSGWMLGNNSQGDAMLRVHSDQTQNGWMFPPGASWRFPSVSEATATDYLDIHGGCTPGMWGTLILDLYYKPEILPPPPPPDPTSTAAKP